MTDELETDGKEGLSKKEMHEQAKQLLALTDLVERYPAVVSRRVTGLIYVLIGGGISLAALLFSTLVTYFPEITSNIFIILSFVVGNLLLAWFIVFRLITPLTKSYAMNPPTDEGMSSQAKITWGILAIAIVVISWYAFGSGQVYLFPIAIQLVLLIGNIGNYFEAKKDPKEAPFAMSQLVFVLLIAVSLIPIILLPPIAFPIMILVDIGGIYGLGIYMLISAERLLLEVTGRE
jgi:hypothetical protein